MKYLVILVPLLSLVVSSHCEIFPKDYEITYEYETWVNTTVIGSVPTTAAFLIKAKLVAVGLDNAVMVTFHNVTFRRILQDRNEEFGSLVDHEESIYLPFVVQHSPDGKTTSLLAHKNDELGSLNTKKAIASIFQLDLSQVHFGKQSTYGFVAEELCLYGTCDVLHSVHPDTDKNTTRITKHFQPSSYNILRQTVEHVIHSHRCSTEFKNPLSVSIERTYDVVHQNGLNILDRVETQNLILLTPFNAKKDVHTVTLQQVLKKINIVQMSGVAPHHREDDMQYHKVKLNWMNQGEAIKNDHDITGIKPSLDKEYLKSFLGHLRSFYIYLTVNNINLSTIFLKREQTVHFLLDEMKVFSIENFSECYKMLQENESQELFLRLLPFLGTRASIYFIAELIDHYNLDPVDSMLLLQEFPSHAKEVDVSIIKKFLNVAEKGEEIVRNVTTLAISSLITKHIQIHPNDPAIETFVDLFIDKFTSATTYGEQILYINALNNIKSKKVTKFFEKIIRKKIRTPTHIRCLAMWGVKVEHSTNHDALNKYHWPILQDKTEHLEVRTTALNILMTRPTMGGLLKMYWIMQNKISKELYSNYYTLLKSMAHSTMPCSKLEAYRASRVLRMPHKPIEKSVKSFDYLFDYFDPRHGFGMSLRSTVISADYTSLFLKYTPKSPHMNSNSIAVYVYTPNGNKTPGYKGYMFRGHGIHSYLPDSIYENIDITYMQNNQVIYAEHGPKTVLDSLEMRISQFMINKLWMSVQGNSEVFVPTEIGSPASYYVSQPELEIFNPFTGDKFSFDRFSHKVYGLKIFNPFTTNWQGTRRNHVTNINLSIKFLPDTQGFGLLSNDSKLIGFKSFASGEIFVERSHSHLNVSSKAICDWCRKSINIPIPAKDAVTNIWSHENEYAGMTFKVGTFDCESQFTDLLSDLSDIITKEYNTNWVDVSSMKTPMTVLHLWSYITSSPTSHQCGIGFAVEPNYESITIKTGIERREIKPNKGKLNVDVNAKLSLKNGNSTEWTLSTELDFAEMVSTDLKIRLTKDDYKVCLEAGEIVGIQRVDFRYGLYYGKCSDGKCPSDGTAITVEGKSIHSDEQIRNRVAESEFYQRCVGKKRSVLPCSFQLTSLRQSTYRGKYRNVSENFVDAINLFGDTLFKFYPEKIVRIKDNVTVPDNEFEAIVTYPLLYDTVDLKVWTPENKYALNGLPFSDTWYHFGAIPHNSFFTSKDILTNSFLNNYIYMGSQFKYCEVRKDGFMSMWNQEVSYNLTDEWEVFGADGPLDGSSPTEGERSTNITWKFEVRKVDGKNMAIRLSFNNDVVVITLTDRFELNLNNAIYSFINFDHGSGPWMAYKVILKPYRLLLYMKHRPMVIDFGEEIIIYSPNEDSYSGHCFDYPAPLNTFLSTPESFIKKGASKI